MASLPSIVSALNGPLAASAARFFPSCVTRTLTSFNCVGVKSVFSATLMPAAWANAPLPSDTFTVVWPFTTCGLSAASSCRLNFPPTLAASTPLLAEFNP